MPTLSEYSNVYDTALKLLQKKGYRFWYDEDLDLYYAEKNGWDFASETPCGLLGIVSIYEDKNPQDYVEYWWKDSGENIYKSISKTAPEYTPIWKTSK